MLVSECGKKEIIISRIFEKVACDWLIALLMAAAS
jgi:hypothetical protein